MRMKRRKMHPFRLRLPGGRHSTPDPFGREALEGEGLVRLGAHEALWLFQDRLVDGEERVWTNTNVDSVTLKHFPYITGEKLLGRPVLLSNGLSKNFFPRKRQELQEGPADRPHGGSAEELQEGPTEELQEGPAEELQEGPTEELQEDPVEELQEGPAEELQDGSAEEPQERQTEELQDEPTEELQEGPTEELQERP